MCSDDSDDSDDDFEEDSDFDEEPPRGVKGAAKV